MVKFVSFQKKKTKPNLFACAATNGQIKTPSPSWTLVFHRRSFYVRV